VTTSPESNVPPTKPAAARAEPMPVLPLRDVVVYPHMVIPLFVGREKSILALEQAMKVDKQVLLLAQKQADVDEPAARDLYDVGTIATILQLLKLPDGTVKVLVEGVERASVTDLQQTDYFTAIATPLTDGDQGRPLGSHHPRNRRHLGPRHRQRHDPRRPLRRSVRRAVQLRF